MSCNKALARGSFDSPTVQDVAANGAIQFANTTTTCRDSISFNGGEVTIRKSGTYLVDFNATTVATAAGVEEIQMFRNGNAVPGAHARETAAAVGDSSSLAFATLVTVECGSPVTLSFRSVPATSVSIANVVIAEQGGCNA